MLRKNTQKLLDEIKAKGCLLDREEIVDFYVSNVMTTSCKLVLVYDYKSEKFDRSKDKEVDYTYSDLEFKARQFYRMSLGVLCMEGYFNFRV
jgi:hypothetical protein